MSYDEITILFLLVVIITSFIYALRAAFLTMSYRNRFTSDLALDEIDVKNGTAKIGQRMRLFIVNFMLGILTPLIWIISFIITTFIIIVLTFVRALI